MRWCRVPCFIILSNGCIGYFIYIYIIIIVVSTILCCAAPLSRFYTQRHVIGTSEGGRTKWAGGLGDSTGRKI